MKELNSVEPNNGKKKFCRGPIAAIKHERKGFKIYKKDSTEILISN